MATNYLSKGEKKFIETTPTEGQKMGTSGLRKKTKEVMKGFYLHKFVQCIWDALPEKPKSLIVGGDGRYWNIQAIQIILHVLIANGVKSVTVGQNGVFSTPAVSNLIRKRKADGGLILTASHNPGGLDQDWGIKYNIANGGPAPESVTNAIYDQTLKVKGFYWPTDIKEGEDPVQTIDLSVTGKQTFGDCTVEVIDSVDDYVEMCKQIFNFQQIKALVARKDFPLVLDSLHGVTGPYVSRIAVELGKDPKEIAQHREALPDFGGLHPDPNLTYAKGLVELLNSGNYEFGAAFDGDGDRNMILGNQFFVNPSDSLAVIVDNCQVIPYFKNGLKGASRSMPTGSALDKVVQAKKLDAFEVPTGWKFFGNLMDSGKIQICGEESFGTGSDHIREKDGIWAMLCWLSIIASRNSDPSKPLVGVKQIVENHWKTYGRNFFTRYDYEEIENEIANKWMTQLREKVNKGELIGKNEIKSADDFEYTDPIDKSVSQKQGIRIVFNDGSRLIFRLSGTSTTATMRMYIDKYESDPAKFNDDPQDVLKDFIKLGLEVSEFTKITGREKPTVIT